MGGKGSKKETVREEVWGENRLVEEDGWGGITSYNLLDLQVAPMDTGLLVTSTTVKILKLYSKRKIRPFGIKYFLNHDVQGEPSTF